MIRLRTRLLLAMALIVLSAVAVAGIATRTLSRGDFKVSTTDPHADPLQFQQLAEELMRVLDDGGSRERLEAIVETAMAGLPAGYAYRLTAPGGELLAGDATLPAGSAATRLQLGSPSGDLVAQLELFLLGPPATGGTFQEKEFLLKLADGLEWYSPLVGRFTWVIWATIVVLSVLLMAASTARLFGPLERLTSAVRRFGSGQLDARAPATGRDEIAELAGAFNAMADEVEETERVRRNLVRDVAHELRTPLTNVRARVEMLREGLRSPDRAELSALLADASVLERLVEDLEQLALADAGHLELRTEPLDVQPILEAVVASLAGDKPAQPEITIDAAGLPLVEADPIRLRQILTNLLGNALRHTPPDGSIRLSARAGAEALVLEVRDTGEGIPESVLPHVFDRFTRADPARTRATGGSGLGLAITRALVEAHGGTVSVESEVGVGTSFELSLPLADGAPSPAR